MDLGYGKIEFVDMTPVAKTYGGSSPKFPGVVIEGTHNLDSFRSRLKCLNHTNTAFHFLRENLHGSNSNVMPRCFSVGDLRRTFNGNIIEFPDLELFVLLSAIEQFSINTSQAPTFEQGYHSILMPITQVLMFRGITFRKKTNDKLSKKDFKLAHKTITNFYQNPCEFNFRLHIIIDDIVDAIYTEWKNQATRQENFDTLLFMKPQNEGNLPKYQYKIPADEKEKMKSRE